ncbi:DNA invertase (plasmid) [Streptomyces clavuligerus]|uniref:Site-specific recombinase, DNA invertase Pin n=1 Tax=Streptomyces clavuligerus TaxID=1901 RepID=B5GM20_STRCL|nr:hypothetical protein SSCG_00394 [Streptomyces clavuligerus]EFG05021.1 Site-specific recombinase, DNA invertase Pin [Streptomyces clavuligerus]QCS10830.1 DNA invertase [Streptomyces clavuligerus]QPJ97133.1 DNA invertase [Streptomyces clavuligerus]
MPSPRSTSGHRHGGRTRYRALAEHAKREAYPEAVETAHADLADLHTSEVPGPAPPALTKCHSDYTELLVTLHRSFGRQGRLQCPVALRLSDSQGFSFVLSDSHCAVW